MIFNDYGTKRHPSVKLAVTTFMRPRGIKPRVGNHKLVPGHRNAYVVKWE